MNVVKMFSISQSMASIRRYSQINLLKSESVLEHTGFVCLFVYFICEEINASCDEKICVGAALQKAVLHDIDEVVTGDIPRPTKYYNDESESVFSKIAEQGIRQIISEIDFPHDASEKIEENWRRSKAETEGTIVALADLAAVIYKIWEEVILLGNRKLVTQGKQVYKYICELSGSLQLQEAVGTISKEHKNCLDKIISQLMKISEQVKNMEDPMIGAIAALSKEK